MKNELFTGSAVALVTPMHADGTINYETLGKLVDYHLENGTDAIVACATTGESPVLSHEEHCKVVEFIVKRVAKKIPVIASSGSNNTAYALELSKDLQSVGANGLLMITPYYNKTSQVGFVKHFTYIADRVNLPIVLYNIPSRTGCNILPETYFELSKHPNIVGTKEANGNLAAAAKTAALCGENLAIYSGEDNLTLPILSIGGKGVISTSANLIPKVMSDICHLYFQGNEKESRQLFLKYLDIMDTLFIDVNPMPVKTAMNMVGWDCGKCRLPLTDISKENEAKLRQTLQKYGLLA
jgi:4-hydroxy-tetrahydrodipicolinate synthase